MNDVVKFVRHFLPDYQRRFDESEDKFIRDNGETWAGKKGNSMNELQFCNINFQEALNSYSRKTIEEAWEAGADAQLGAYNTTMGYDNSKDTIEHYLTSKGLRK